MNESSRHDRVQAFLSAETYGNSGVLFPGHDLGSLLFCLESNLVLFSNRICMSV